jgi:biopolymer transport protein ExbD
MTSPSEKIGTINVTPLIDILLVLLIIFMVITPLSSHGINAELPQQSVGTAASKPEPEIVLEITRDHQMLLNGQAVTRAELTAEIAKLYRSRISQQLFIRADGDLEFSEVATAMDEMRGAYGDVQFGLLTKP